MKPNQIILFIVLVVITFGCKVHQTIEYPKTNFKVKMPRSSLILVSSQITDKFSGEFNYLLKDTSKFVSPLYLLPDSIIVGFMSNKTGARDKEEQIRTYRYLLSAFGGGCKKSSLLFKELNSGDREYLTFYYSKNNNNKDYFALFCSDVTVDEQIWGTIRFPAYYTPEMAEKKTKEILSYIKYGK